MWLLTALLLGLTGSLHCAGMCGPLIFAIPAGDKPVSRFFKLLPYHAGRISVYMSIGILFGILGQGLAFAGLQQSLSIAAGIVLLLLAFTGLRTPGGKAGKLLLGIRTKLTSFLREKGGVAMFAAGCGNGLLPCGLVYAAIAGALAQGSISGGAVFMLFFGIGTVPLLAALPFARKLLPGLVPYTKTIIRTSAFLVAALLILRGLNLGIPYLSPEINHAANVVHSCH